MKGANIIDYIFVIIIFLLVAIIIIGVLRGMFSSLAQEIESGKIYDKIENFLKKVIGR